MSEEFILVSNDPAPENIQAEPTPADPVIIKPDVNAGEPKKRGRGRPKKDASPGDPKPERKKPVSEKSLFDELREKGKQYSEPKPEINIPGNQELTTPPPPSNNLLNGYLILLICDAFLPLIVVRIARARGNKGITAKQLKLTTSEKKELEPIADAAAAQLLPSMSPVSQFLLAISSVYITKVV